MDRGHGVTGPLVQLLAKYTKACEIVKVPPLSRMSVLEEAMISLNDHGLMTLTSRERIGSRLKCNIQVPSIVTKRP